MPRPSLTLSGLVTATLLFAGGCADPAERAAPHPGPAATATPELLREDASGRLVGLGVRFVDADW